MGQKRVPRLMKHGGLVGVHRRRGVRTTRRGPDGHAAADLVQGDFTATAPDQLWVADITYVPTWAGFLYLAVVLDARSRRVVGRAMATHLKTDLVLAALARAYCAWERGLNENTNGLLRQFLPKRASMAHLTQQACNSIARQLNHRPRKRLNYRTPEECYVP